MIMLRTLLTLENAKLIVIDEGLSAPYGKYFLTGCLQQLMEARGNNHTKLEVLSLSEPTYRCISESGTAYRKSAIVHDCYALDVSCSAEKAEDYLTKFEYVISRIDRKSIVLVDCLNSLLLNVGTTKCFQLLKKITERSCQLLCIHRERFAAVTRTSSLVKTLGTTYVKLSACPSSYAALSNSERIAYVAKIVHRKAGGSTIRQTKLIVQSIISYEIIEEREELAKPDDTMPPAIYGTARDQGIESSFRIQISDQEMEQKRKTLLPYTISANTSPTSKIIYRPEDIDDLDEEDPDDDLCF